MPYSVLSSSVTNLCRFAVAMTFMVSGFVKAVDPIGTQIKIEDYLAAWGMAQAIPEVMALVAAVAMAATEFALGMLLLFAIRRRLVTRLIMAFMTVMTPLTLWLAISNPVSDCGCFGDAIVLTNWETFFKNVILTAAALRLVMHPTDMMRLVSIGTQWIVINYTILFVLALSAYSLYMLPPFDFRPYHIGADIRKGMEIPEGAEQPQFETTFILEKNGERREFTLDNYPDSSWTFIDSRTVQTSEGYVPPIHDFSITRIADDEDITDEVINSSGYTMLLVAPYLEKSDDMQFSDINRMYDYAQENGVPFYCLTAGDRKAISRWQDLTGAEYPFCLSDGTTLKTVIRSNPGLLLLKDGTIIGKWSHNELPVDKLAKPLAQSTIGQMPDDKIAHKIVIILLWFVLPLALLSIADRLWAWSSKVRAAQDKQLDRLKKIESELNIQSLKKKVK